MAQAARAVYSGRMMTKNVLRVLNICLLGVTLLGLLALSGCILVPDGGDGGHDDHHDDHGSDHGPGPAGDNDHHNDSH
jgi:hypothetical protein